MKTFTMTWREAREAYEYFFVKSMPARMMHKQAADILVQEIGYTRLIGWVKLEREKMPTITLMFD